MKVEGECPAPGIVLMPVFISVRCNRSQSCSSKEMKRVLRPNSRFLKFEGRKMSSMSWQQLQTDDKKTFRHQNTAKILWPDVKCVNIF